MSANRIPQQDFNTIMHRIRIQRGLAFGVIIIAALIMFEMFNYSTTEYALTDLLGDLKFLGIPWATILALAFCGIDFAGIARLHTPEDGAGQQNETWYLFGAWLLGATMNAMLTWWGVSLAIINHNSTGTVVLGQSTLLKVVPIFVAVLVWLIRVLIIGTYSIAGTRLLSQKELHVNIPSRSPIQQSTQISNTSRGMGNVTASGSYSTGQANSQRSGLKAANESDNTTPRQEPIYSNLSAAGPSRSAFLPQRSTYNTYTGKTRATKAG
jgi:hypothetical protein